MIPLSIAYLIVDSKKKKMITILRSQQLTIKYKTVNLGKNLGKERKSRKYKECKKCISKNLVASNFNVRFT